MNRIVRPPERRRRSSASARTARTSFTPAVTAESSVQVPATSLEITLASEVLPAPGGPHRMREASSPLPSIATSGASASVCPTYSARERGRIRAASGVPAGQGARRGRRDRVGPGRRYVEESLVHGATVVGGLWLEVGVAVAHRPDP